MFYVVNHQDKKVIVAYKGTSRWMVDISHDVLHIALGQGVAEVSR